MIIVAAVDRSSRSSIVVREAQHLADVFGDDLHVVHVLSLAKFLDIEQTSAERTGTPVDLEQVREYAADVAAEAAGGIEGSSESAGLVGDPADEVVRYADKRDARYVVVGPRRRSPTGKALFGSVAQSILLNADCPVVTTVSQEAE